MDWPRLTFGTRPTLALPEVWGPYRPAVGLSRDVEHYYISTISHGALN